MLILLALMLAQSVAVVDATEKVYQSDTSLPNPAAAAQIQAAQNEFEGFQVVVTGPASNVSVSAGALTGPGGAQLLASSAGSQGAIMVYREAFITLPASGSATDPSAKEGNVPDALIPQYDEFYQEARNLSVASLASGKNAVFFIDVHVPPNAAAGVYTGQVTVTASGKQTAVPVTLTVYPFALPSTPTLKTVIRFGWNAAALQYPSISGQCCNDTVAQMHLKHAILGVNHRITIHSFDYGSSDDLTAYKRNFGALINGTASTLLAGAHPTVLQYQGSHGSGNTLAAWHTFFQQNGWLNYLIDYAADEPADGQNSTWCSLSANAAEDAANGVRAVTTAAIADAAKATCSGKALNLSTIAVFTPVVDRLQPLTMTSGHSTIGDYASWRAGSLNGQTNEVWEYQSCDSWGCGGHVATGWPSYAIDHSAIRARALEWISFRNGITGELYWSSSEAWNDLTLTPWTNQYATGGNGDGTLIYPGAASNAQVGGTHDIPLATLRMKMLREGVEDYEYMQILSQLGGSANDQIDAVFPTAHDVTSASPSALYAARATIACRIITSQHPDWGCDPSTWGTAALTVSMTGVGTGTVTSTPAGINCGSGGTACTARFAAGTQVTLLATPDTRASFDNFSGGCTGVETTCVMTLSSGASVTASFGPPPGHLSMAPQSVTFASVQVGNAPPAQWLVLLNDGGKDLSWTAQSDDSAVTLSSSSGTLSPGASTTLTLTAATQDTAGSRTSHLTIVTAAGSATVPMNLSFTTSPPPPPPPAQLEVAPLSLSFSSWTGTAPPSQSIIISDTGGQGMSFGISSDDPAVVPATTSGDLAPGASMVVAVSVAASADASARSANLTVNAGAGGQAIVAVGVNVVDNSAPDGGSADAGSSAGGATSVTVSSTGGGGHGCSHAAGSTAGWLFIAAALALAFRHRRR